MRQLLLFLLCSLYFSLTAQQTVGLFQNDSQSYNGYILFAPLTSKNTYLIDNCGHLIHVWESDYQPANSVYLLENGNLLRTGRTPSSTFSGGGIGGYIEILNWEGEVLWQMDYAGSEFHHHHDVEYLPNGNILILAWEYRSNAEAIQAGRNPDLLQDDLWPEQIVEIMPTGAAGGEIVWEWHLWDHLVQDFDETKDNYGVVADHPELMDVNFSGNFQNPGPDWVHANAISYNEELDQVMLTSRHLNEIWVIDHSTTSEEAAGHSGGDSGRGGDLLYRWGNPQTYDRATPQAQKLFGPHDGHWIPADLPDGGKVLIFNNGPGRPQGNYSSVDLINPPMNANGQYLLEENESFLPVLPEWTFVASPPGLFFSTNVSGAQRLPNGNTLICEGIRGNFFEITPDKEIVWEYVNPVSNSGPVAQGQTPVANSVFRAYRYGPDYPGLEGKDLTPGDPIELNPLPEECIISSVAEINYDDHIRVFPNPVGDQLTITIPELEEVPFQIHDQIGRVISQGHISGGTTYISTNNWPSGIYTLKLPDGRVARIVR